MGLGLFWFIFALALSLMGEGVPGGGWWMLHLRVQGFGGWMGEVAGAVVVFWVF